MNFTEKIEEILQKEAQAILDIPVTDQFEKAVELIVEQVHRKGGKLVTSGMGNSHEYRYHILLDRDSCRISSPQRSSTRGFGHIAKKRFDAGHLQLGENSRNTRTSSTGFELDARIEIHRHYREQPKRTRLSAIFWS